MLKDRLSPSMMCASFFELATQTEVFEKNGIELLHIDVMDGQFVPEITYGQPVIRSIRKLTSLPFDVHLMVENPELQIESFAKCGADWITFHLEAGVHAHRIVQHIHELGKKAGVSIVPSTPISALEELLEYVDIILVMTVNPGYGGQSLIPSCVRKIQELKRIREEKGYNFKISVDGGVNSETLKIVADAGADIIVSGSAFFNGSLNWNF